MKQGSRASRLEIMKLLRMRMSSHPRVAEEPIVKSLLDEFTGIPVWGALERAVLIHV